MPDALTLTLTSEKLARYVKLAELNEKQIRLLAGLYVDAMGYGGQKAVASVLELSVNTVHTGRTEFEEPQKARNAVGRIRRPGGGRKAAEVSQPGVVQALEGLLENNSYGDPERVLFWTTLSLRDIQAALEKQGFHLSHVTVGRLIEQLGYSKQQNQKMLQVGEPHPDRDAQFRFIEATVEEFLARGEPVISVDCKKKELIGNFKNNGHEYRKEGDPREVWDHDFMVQTLGKVAPYGVYVLNNNTGFVNLTQCSDTSEFAVESIRAWWYHVGHSTFPKAKRLLVTCDAGGSNGCRVRLWKEQLGVLAEELGIEIHVCHFPSGTSKWNKVEHRLFCYISKNWEGKPLIDVETVVKLIGNTKTKTGLVVHCQVDERIYERGVKVSDERMTDLDLSPVGNFEKWNYIIRGFRSFTFKC